MEPSISIIKFRINRKELPLGIAQKTLAMMSVNHDQAELKPEGIDVAFGSKLIKKLRTMAIKFMSRAPSMFRKYLTLAKLRKS